MPDELTPDHKLAANIVRELLDAKLMHGSKKESVRGALLDGSATEEDWRNWVDNALFPREVKEDEVNAD